MAPVLVLLTVGAGFDMRKNLCCAKRHHPPFLPKARRLSKQNQLFRPESCYNPGLTSLLCQVPEKGEIDSFHRSFCGKVWQTYIFSLQSPPTSAIEIASVRFHFVL